MDRIGSDDLARLFDAVREAFARERDHLIDLDGKVGDSDLGITMSKGFAAVAESVRATAAEPLGRRVQLAGAAMAKAAPSTMGTLMATGLMRGGKALADHPAIDTAGLAAFWAAFEQGVAERGKAKPGDKTLLDVLGPVARALAAAGQDGLGLGAALDRAAAAAADGLEATRHMVAQHGKAACFQEKSLGLQDAGATAARILVDAMRDFVNGDTA